jgi:hypothetical protein
MMGDASSDRNSTNGTDITDGANIYGRAGRRVAAA